MPQVLKAEITNFCPFQCGREASFNIIKPLTGYRISKNILKNKKPNYVVLCLITTYLLIVV